MNRKPVTLEDLDRDELLQLVRYNMLWRESDLVWAQWEAACARLKPLRDRHLAMFDALAPLSRAFDDALEALRAVQMQGDYRKVAGALRRLDRARTAYDAKKAEQDKLERQIDRLDKRKDGLYALYQELVR
ncbi:MAG: hypothetical protein AB1918_00645 [Pseudomonadota bacterium]